MPQPSAGHRTWFPAPVTNHICICDDPPQSGGPGGGGGGPTSGDPIPTQPLDGVTVTAPPPPPPVYFPPTPGNPPISDPGNGGDYGHGGGGGAPPPTPLITKTEIVVGECAGLQKALSAQVGNHKEEAGYTTTDGKVILLPMDQNTDHSISVSFPIYDSDHHLVTNGPFLEDGVWKIDMNDYTNGHQVTEYTISYYFHTHPTGTTPDGSTYDSDNPSPDDYTNAKQYSGMVNHIVNKDNEVVYDSTQVVSTSKNHCP